MYDGWNDVIIPIDDTFDNWKSICEFGKQNNFETIVTIQPIAKGESLSKENVWVKRPGTGEIKADSYNEILGKVVNKNIKIDKHLSWADLDG